MHAASEATGPEEMPAQPQGKPVLLTYMEIADLAKDSPRYEHLRRQIGPRMRFGALPIVALVFEVKGRFLIKLSMLPPNKRSKARARRARARL